MSKNDEALLPNHHSVFKILTDQNEIFRNYSRGIRLKHLYTWIKYTNLVLARNGAGFHLCYTSLAFHYVFCQAKGELIMQSQGPSLSYQQHNHFESEREREMQELTERIVRSFPTNGKC